MQPTRILLLEDDLAAGQLLHDFLVQQAYELLWVRDGHTALAALQQQAFELAVLDVMVPGPDGRTVLRHIREQPATASLPVLMLTARDQEQDEIQGLAAGADDYLAKPASLHRILARIQTLLRRNRITHNDHDILRIGPLQLDWQAALATINGQPLELTTTELQLLRTLLAQPRRVFRRAELLEHATSHPDEVLERTVDVHIKNLRLKLAAAHPAGAGLLRTVRGIGYGLNPEWPSVHNF